MHQIVPVFSGTHVQSPAFLRLFNRNTADTVNDHRAGIVFQKENVTALAQNKNRLVVLRCMIPCGQQLLRIVGSHDLSGISVDTEGIPGLKGVIHRRYPDAKTGIVYPIG